MAKGRCGATLQQVSILQSAARKLTGVDQQAILTQWSELFRTGLLAWGMNLSNPDPPFFHLTESGRKALENATRDPSNPAGYLRHLDSFAPVGAVTKSYLVEALDCYAAGFAKAAAVMVGVAAESVINDLRDAVITKLNSKGKAEPKRLGDWRIKIVTDELRNFFEQHKAQLGPDLKNPFEVYWPAFAFQIRAVRNDAGHPKSVEPVTPDSVHASLLIFPELARLADQLRQWTEQNLN